MSQRTIPKSLRLQILKNWESSWILQNKEYSNFFLIEHQIKFFFNKIFKKYQKDFFFDKTVINKINNNIFIIINYEKNLQKFSKLKIKNFQNEFLILSRIIENYFNKKYNVYIEFSEIGFKFLSKNLIKIQQQKLLNKSKLIKNKKLLDFIVLLIKFKKIEIFNTFLSINLKKMVKHTKYLKSIDFILKNLINLKQNFIKGYKIQFKGRINGKTRSRAIIYQYGKTPFNTLEKKGILYDQKDIFTKNGVYSLKTWIFTS